MTPGDCRPTSGEVPDVFIMSSASRASPAWDLYLRILCPDAPFQAGLPPPRAFLSFQFRLVRHDFPRALDSEEKLIVTLRRSMRALALTFPPESGLMICGHFLTRRRKSAPI
jgi:hypothetical protein